MQEVVALLAPDLRHERAQLFMGRRLERLEPQRVGVVVEPVPGERVAPVTVGALAQDRVPVLVLLATEREPVGVVAGDLRDERVVRGGVPDLVLRDRRERNVFLDMRREAGPLGVAVAQDQLVVGERQQHRNQWIGHEEASSFARALARSRFSTTSR